MDEIMKGVKIGKLLGKDEKKETCKVIALVVGVIATIAAIAGAAYAIYRFVNRDDYDDFEDDFDDLFDEDDEDEDDFEDQCVMQKKDSYRGSEALYSCFFANNENNTLDWR